MRRQLAWSVGLTAWLVAASSCAAESSPRGRTSRSGPRSERSTDSAPKFEAAESAGLFVGVQRFPSDESLVEVPFAVDDAVDLAYRFSLGLKQPLIPPQRVVLALYGQPRKVESAGRLKALIEAGAKQVPAYDTDITTALKSQTDLVGAGGLLVVSFATHGVRERGRDFLLAASSLDRAVSQTSVSVTKMNTMLSRSQTWRRLILLDACRENRVRDSRSARKGAPLRLSAREFEGQALLAARPNELLYDDPERRQGVFTAGVLAGLECQADRNEDGAVTIAELADFVDDEVAGWTSRRPQAFLGTSSRGIERRVEGSIGEFPLVSCR